MRRSQWLLCAAAALMLGGCQATDTDDPPETSHGLKVEHALGTTKVPGMAQRPVALYPSELDDAFALDAAPVGAAGVLPEYLSRRTKDARTKLVGPISNPDLGRIAALKPDLILAGKQSQRRFYRRLKKIAPTVVIDQDVDWKPNLRQDGEALGHTDFAEKLLSEYDFLAAKTRDLIRRRGQPKLPAAVRPGLSRPFVASILDDVGVKHPKVRHGNVLGGVGPGPYDAWTLGMGYIAATRILTDLQRFTGG